MTSLLSGLQYRVQYRVEDSPTERKPNHTPNAARMPAAIGGPTLLRGSIAILGAARRHRERARQSDKEEG